MVTPPVQHLGVQNAQQMQHVQMEPVLIAILDIINLDYHVQNAQIQKQVQTTKRIGPWAAAVWSAVPVDQWLATQAQPVLVNAI